MKLSTNFGAIRDAAHKIYLYQGVLYFHNVIRLHGHTRLNVIPLMTARGRYGLS